MPRDAAEETIPDGLIYVSDFTPGISRRRCGKGWAYYTAEGEPIRCPRERARIAALGIPPAYSRVWICPLPNGHLQATGYDALGRKQYRYHPDWSSWRAQGKYAQLPAFGEALGRLRRQVERDLKRDPGELEFSLAALVLLLDRAHLRVGSSEYADDNGTYGATTLLTRHVSLKNGVVRLSYRAKGGKRVRQTLRDKRLHRIFQDIEDLPGRHLFTYITESGEVRQVQSHHVNAYLAEISGLDGVSAKTFRTWAGSVAAFATARATEGRLTVRAMAQAAAAELLNTPAISRSSYIHPRILDLAALDHRERRALLERIEPQGASELRADERRLLGFLRS